MLPGEAGTIWQLSNSNGGRFTDCDLLVPHPHPAPPSPSSLIRCHLPLERHSSFGNAPAFSFSKSKGTLHDSDLWFFFLSVGISYIHLFLKVRIWIVIRIGIILLSLSNHSLTDRSWGFLEKRNQNWLVRLHLSSLFTLKQTGPVGQGKSGLNLHCHIVVHGLGLWHTLGFESHFLLL